MPDKDRPAGMLQIPRSTEKEVEKWRDGKAPAPPVEHFLPDSALAEIERASRAKAEPVRADRLYPITAGEAAARRTQAGAELPKMPAPRRVIPAPFQRPRVTGGSHGKAWQEIRAENLSLGDIVPGVGRVVARSVRTVYVSREAAEQPGPLTGPVSAEPGEDKVAVGEVVLVEGAGREVKAFRFGTYAQAFRKAV